MSAYQTFQLIAVIVIAAAFGLSAAGRRYPHVAWLRPFSNAFPRLPEDQRRKARQRGDFHTGIELIFFGLVLPVGYLFLSTMTFSSVTPTEMVLVGVGSLVCIGLGIMAIRSSRR